jgi:sialate O-acetylesterase
VAFEQSDEFKDMIATVPTSDLDAIAKKKVAEVRKKIEDMQGPLNNNGNTAQWKEGSFDDSKWPHMKLPGTWEEQGLPELDGVVWFRKEVTIGDADAGKAGIVSLAKIDDEDETYVNGAKVGSNNKWDEDRRYTIPAGVLKAGKNTIAVRVKDNGGGGGIYGDPLKMELTVNGKSQSLAGEWSFKVESMVEGNASLGPNSYPTLLFNAMLNPLIPFAFKGVIWYQGESNAGRANQYRKAFPLMINDWRKHWGVGDFPFYFVQLSSFNAGNGNSVNGSSWAELREAQTMTLALPNTGMAVTTDIGDAKDIHPKDKQDVGKRLAAIALSKTYGMQGEYSGPIYESMKVEGNRVIISFTHSNGLLVKDKYGYIKGFEIAGEDHQFHFAKAMTDGNKIIVWQDGVSSPQAVRYAWADDAGEANLFNKEGFPASAFRTDNWKGITEGNKFVPGQ